MTKVPLSVAEFASLQALASESPPAIPFKHGLRLCQAGLAEQAPGALKLTDAGRDRVRDGL